MEIIKPTKQLLKFGFTNDDLIILDSVLEKLAKDNLITIINISDQLFDFGSFVEYVICDKSFRKRVIEVYNEILRDLENTLLSYMTFDANSLSFKLNLFILIINSLEKDNEVNPLFNQFLELDKNVSKYHITLIDAFFEMIRLKNYSVINVLNIFSKSNLIERSGWTLSNIPSKHLESIAEHMYSMYTLGLIYLPNDLGEEGYDKNKVLQMALLHDLGETLTGDIPHPSKTYQDEIIEDLKMKSLLCNLMYNEVECAKEQYNLWCDWNMNISINAKLAHDLDVLQLNYQLFTYAVTYQDVFSDDELRKWTRRKPMTTLGKNIFDKLILNNPKFKERIGILNGK